MKVDKVLLMSMMFLAVTLASEKKVEFHQRLYQ